MLMYCPIFIARRHAMHAERDDIVLPIFCSSLCLPVLCVTFFHTLAGTTFVFFELDRRHKIPTGTPSVGR